MVKKKLLNIDFSQVMHEDDVALKEKLDSIPGFKKFITDTVCALREKYVGIEFAGNGLHVNKDSLPELYGLMIDTCETLGMKQIPEFSLMWYYGITMGTEGATSPKITAMSGAIDLLTEDEITFLIGHELGHQACGHKPYHMMLETLFMPLIKHIPGGETWISVVKLSLLNWYRMSDFTADRVGLLACQDINVALRTLIKMAGIPKKYYNNINIDAFIKQTAEFNKDTSGGVEKIISSISINAACSPWTVNRAAKLLEWYNSGEYEKIINK